MARPIEFNEGQIIIQRPVKAVVRFPTEEEQALGIMEVPREQRLKEAQDALQKKRV